jgi:O-antigen/teichoic acid export membrane protein
MGRNFDKLSSTISTFSKIGKEHWNYGKPILFGIILYWVANQGYFVYSSYELTDKELGSARASQNLLGMLMLIILSMENTLTPIAARISTERGVISLKKYLQKNYKYIFSAFVVLTLLYISICNVLFVNIYGKNLETPNTNKLLICFGVLQVTTLLNRFISIYIKVLTKTKIFTVSYGMSALFIVVFGMVFVKNYRDLGIAIGLTLSSVLSSFVLVIYVSSNKLNLMKNK